MKNKLEVIRINFIILLLFVILGSISYAQTEGFNVKTPIQKISESTSKFLKSVIGESQRKPKESISQDLVCSAECFLVIPTVEIIESRGDFTGTGLLACRAPNSNKFTEPLFYKINNLDSFEEAGGGLLILATDKAGMKSILGNDVHLNSDNISVGPIGNVGDTGSKSFAAYVKYKDQELSGTDLSGSVLEYSSKDTFNAYQGTVVPIEILISPQDVPPLLRDFDSLLTDWTKDCK
ncbi:MAG: hypothetical protein N2A97_04265 [Thermodesulfobacteriales bacterium]